jgi:hypothetical protein
MWEREDCTTRVRTLGSPDCTRSRFVFKRRLIENWSGASIPLIILDIPRHCIAPAPRTGICWEG